jgi:hypothetical protein
MLSLYRMFLLKWMARAGSVICLATAIVFLGSVGFDPNQIKPLEWLGLLFFPVGVLAGEIVAWRWEGWGSLTSILSLAVFYLIYGAWASGDWWRDLAILIFSAPAFLFLVDRLMLGKGGQKYGKAGIQDQKGWMG